MCGIVGAVVRPGALDAPDIERAIGSLSHRGPDGRGVVRAGRTEHWEVWLGHARLAIVDLSPGGAQPMRRGASTITFNGEVYNHRELRKALEPDVTFTSQSDTEVLLAGLQLQGPSFLKRTNAMLALGLWDADRGELLLARDRLGKKPLYVFRDENHLLFASELKALAALGAPLDLDETSLALFRWLGYVPDPLSIWRGVRKLSAGAYARFDLRSQRLPDLVPEDYWDPLGGLARTFDGSLEEAVDEVLTLLDDATRIRLEADVPVGVFLSGGIDSTLVASSVARTATRRTTAFTIQAAEARFDESSVARETAHQLGLDFEALPLPLDAYAKQTEKIPWHYDEPLADLSQIATMANAEAARKRVTVVLTGDGGDEVFLGYPWVRYPERLWQIRRKLSLLPGTRQVARAALGTRAGFELLRMAVSMMGLNAATLDAKNKILREALRTDHPEDLYERFHCARQRETLLAADRARLPVSLLGFARELYPTYGWQAAAARSMPELLGALDLVTYMRSDILVKVDRATMAYSLEARSPLLDYRLVELGLSLPLAYKAHAGKFKRVLRLACARRIGERVASRPKQGFGIPEPAGPSTQTGSSNERWAAETERAFFATWPSAGLRGNAA